MGQIVKVTGVVRIKDGKVYLEVPQQKRLQQSQSGAHSSQRGPGDT